MEKVGLLFGTFNPIHLGHLLIAEEGIRRYHLDKVRLVLTNCNPYKKGKEHQEEIASYQHRAKMCQLAITSSQLGPLRKKLSLELIEKNLPIPNYTHVTLELLQKQKKRFYLLVGEDNKKNISSWKQGDWIVKNFDIINFERTSKTSPNKSTKSSKHFDNDNPIYVISSTQIRSRIKKCLEEKVDLEEQLALLTLPKVIKYIKEKKPFPFQKKVSLKILSDKIKQEYDE